MRYLREFCSLIVVFVCMAGRGAAQETFSLVAPGVAAASSARVTPNELSIRDAGGTVTRYQRAPRYDTKDGHYNGYSSREAQQVIRWPSSNSGRMQIGTLVRGQIEFTFSKMTITAAQGGNNLQDANWPSGNVENTEILPNQSSGSAGINNQNLGDGSSVMLMHLAAGDSNERLFLTRTSSGQLGFNRTVREAESAWYIVPVSDNIVRLQQRQGNDWFALSAAGNVQGGGDVLPPMFGSFGGGAFPRGGSFGGGGGFQRNRINPLPVNLLPLQGGLNQLWYLNSINNVSGGYCFESLLHPGMGLTCVPGGALCCQPMVFNPYQTWWPQQPTFQLPAPQYRTVNHQIVPNPALPPVDVRVKNTHTETIVVLLTDRRNPRQPQKLRIPASGSQTVQLERDAGSTIEETVETMDAYGNWSRNRFVTPVPPAVLYDVSVYEEFLQSIAIDRTGTSPNPIEDVNYQPRSIGFFLVPPGDAVPPNSELDAYGNAEDMQNPGAVRKLSGRDLKQYSPNEKTADPLKDLLDKFQRKRAAF